MFWKNPLQLKGMFLPSTKTRQKVNVVVFFASLCQLVYVRCPQYENKKNEFAVTFNRNLEKRPIMFADFIRLVLSVLCHRIQ